VFRSALPPLDPTTTSFLVYHLPACSVLEVAINTAYALEEAPFIATCFGSFEASSGNVHMTSRKLLCLQRIRCFFVFFWWGGCLNTFIIRYLVAFDFGYNSAYLIKLRLLTVIKY
jgi:hypothetical protein